MRKVRELPPSSPLRRAPLYEQAADRLREAVQTLEPDAPLPSEREMAAEYGVSLNTMREAVRILAEEGWVARRQGLGTFTARPVAKGEVALVVHHDMTHPGSSAIYHQITQAVQARLDQAGIASRLYISRRKPGLEQTDLLCPEFFRDLEENRISGVIGILLAANSPWFQQLEERGLLLLGYGEGKPFSVTSSARTFYREAIAEMVQMGRTRLGFIGWGGYAAHRSESATIFRDCLTEAGLPIVEPWIKDDIYPGLEGSGWGAFREMMSALNDQPDGVIVSDDYFLPGIAMAMAEGSWPRPEVAAMVHQGIDYPLPLHGWRQDVEAMAELLAEAQIALLRGEKVEPGKIVVEPLRIGAPVAVEKA